MRWLITGGCGFLGVNLVRELVTQGCHGIRIIDDLSIGTRADLKRVADFSARDVAYLGAVPESGVELVTGDILDRSAIERAAQGAQIMVHFAANAGVAQSVANPLADCMINVVGTVNCLEAARLHQVGRFVFASSGAPIGEAEPPIHENLPAHPVSPYGASKLAGEGYCSAYARSFGIDTVALRFGNVYGPGSGRKSSVVAAFMTRALAGEPLIVYGDGRQTRDFIYVDDLIHAVCLAAKTEEIGGEIFQIATSRETSLDELLDQLVPLLLEAGLTPQIEHAAPRLGDVRRNFSDTAKARDVLGWHAKVGLHEGLECTLRWFLEARRP